MTRSRYFVPVKWLGGSAIVAFVLALILPFVRDALFNETARAGVLLQALPFVAGFAGILLLFILLIVLMIMRFNGRMPQRLYRPIEVIIIAGIIAGVACLFQPLHFVGYKYGFVLVLASTLAFILWSHIVPRSTTQDAHLPPITRAQHSIGLAAGIAVLVILTYSAAVVNEPKPPFGIRQRVWDTYAEERKAEITAKTLGDFRNVELPFLLVFNLFPAAAAYFLVRELAGMGSEKTKPIAPD